MYLLIARVWRMIEPTFDRADTLINTRTIIIRFKLGKPTKLSTNYKKL